MRLEDEGTYLAGVRYHVWVVPPMGKAERVWNGRASSQQRPLPWKKKGAGLPPMIKCSTRFASHVDRSLQRDQNDIGSAWSSRQPSPAGQSSCWCLCWFDHLILAGAGLRYGRRSRAMYNPRLRVRREFKGRLYPEAISLSRYHHRRGEEGRGD